MGGRRHDIMESAGDGHKVQYDKQKPRWAYPGYFSPAASDDKRRG